MNNVNAHDYQIKFADSLEASVESVFIDPPLSWFDRFLKRSFDIAISILLLMACSLVIFIAYIFATISTGKNGLFFQDRVGKNGKLFRTVKIRTMKDIEGIHTSVTSVSDPRITRVGRFLRRTKVDELPQLWNVLIGEMSLVGPRPDVPGFADRLVGNDRAILAIRPGITGPATLMFRHEEELLANQSDPEAYNREVIFPEKVKINLEYIANYSLSLDIKCLYQTVMSN